MLSFQRAIFLSSFFIVKPVVSVLFSIQCQMIASVFDKL